MIGEYVDWPSARGKEMVACKSSRIDLGRKGNSSHVTTCTSA